MIENCRIRGESGDRVLIDVSLQCARIEQVAGDVVKPKALASIVKHLCSLHRVTSIVVIWPGRQISRFRVVSS